MEVSATLFFVAWLLILGAILAATLIDARISRKHHQESEEELKSFMAWAHQENLAADKRIQDFLLESRRETQKSLDRLSALTGMVFERVDQNNDH